MAVRLPPFSLRTPPLTLHRSAQPPSVSELYTLYRRLAPCIDLLVSQNRALQTDLTEVRDLQQSGLREQRRLLDESREELRAWHQTLASAPVVPGFSLFSSPSTPPAPAPSPARGHHAGGGRGGRGQGVARGSSFRFLY